MSYSFFWKIENMFLSVEWKLAKKKNWHAWNKWTFDKKKYTMLKMIKKERKKSFYAKMLLNKKNEKLKKWVSYSFSWKIENMFLSVEWKVAKKKSDMSRIKGVDKKIPCWKWKKEVSLEKKWKIGLG